MIEETHVAGGGGEVTKPDEIRPLPVVRSAIGGLLMGLANLVPGISGGTMIVIMGLYEEFVRSIADVTRLRLTRRNVMFLGIVGLTALGAIASLAGVMSRTVTLHRSAMFSLFIGMTLGGVPVLVRMSARVKVASVVGLALGLIIMVIIVAEGDRSPDREAIRTAVARGTFIIEPNYAGDLTAGALGMAAMVLPGISGAYMLLVLGRYEPILASVSLAKTYVLSLGDDGVPQTFMRVVIPTSIGALTSLVVLSGFLKWMLVKHRDAMVGLLLGILLGSILGIWPFDKGSGPQDYAAGAALSVLGFAATALLSRIKA
ncbi:MAG: DUF368 domain-containing protein [Phycisphaerae bacterium]